MNPEEAIKKATGKDPDNPTVIWRSRMHVLAAAITPGIEAAYLNVWCDCGWHTPAPSALDADVESFQDISDKVLAQAVQPWRDHLRLSGRMFRMHRDITKAEKRAERDAEKVWPEGTADHPGQLKGNDATARSAP